MIEVGIEKKEEGIEKMGEGIEKGIGLMIDMKIEDGRIIEKESGSQEMRGAQEVMIGEAKIIENGTKNIYKED
ncbi:unnamed protein product [Callosobruchus maculatus]|uniref:Uncharacterized protein n=1 Tax=Callosobruchus maculatus TaxID=64391 RepID=A0A653D9V3_CALMS|nr:unnamed protein product [Callosobruchus maculatus]